MAFFVARRLLYLVPVLIAVSLLTFSIASLLPGDLALTILADQATPENLAALRRAPRATHPQRPVRGAPMEACWPIGLGVGYPSREVALYDQRDWHNQFHAGRRLRMEGLIEEETP